MGGRPLGSAGLPSAPLASLAAGGQAGGGSVQRGPRQRQQEPCSVRAAGRGLGALSPAAAMGLESPPAPSPPLLPTRDAEGGQSGPCPPLWSQTAPGPVATAVGGQWRPGPVPMGCPLCPGLTSVSRDGISSSCGHSPCPVASTPPPPAYLHQMVTHLSGAGMELAAGSAWEAGRCQRRGLGPQRAECALPPPAPLAPSGPPPGPGRSQRAQLRSAGPETPPRRPARGRWLQGLAPQLPAAAPEPERSNHDVPPT